MSLSKRLINTKSSVDANFNTVLYTGNGSTQSVTGVGFKPDFVWIKGRTFADNHNLADVIRGVNKYVFSNLTSPGVTSSNYLTSFDNDGFTVGSDNSSNKLNEEFVAWCWKAGGAGVTNTDGTTTSQVSANTEKGFSIVNFTSTPSNITVGHGLGNAPSIIFMRSLYYGGNWVVYSSTTGNGEALILNSALGSSGSAVWNYTNPTSNVFSSGFTNQGDVLAYCWAEIPGFSKFGTFIGNGDSSLDPSGTVVAQTITTGFEPAFVLLKQTLSGYWGIFDNKRGGSSPGSQWKWLWPSRNKTESDASYGYSALIDFTPTGFTLGNDASNEWNTLNKEFIYMAFANEF